MSSERRTLQKTLHTLRDAGRIGLLPFVPAGYPDPDTTAATLLELECAGASAIEVGFPFSDPIADGPVIQQAFAEALANGFSLKHVFDVVKQTRGSLSIPLLAMVSFSIVYRRGVDRFVGEARRSGFDALIVPDLPPPEAAVVCQTIRAAGLDTVMLIAPTTPPARRNEIAALCSGFVYYLSLSGTTGARSQLPADVVENVQALRAISSCPVCVGFGISRREHLAMLKGVADGAIVGSALVRRMMQQTGAGAAKIAQEAGLFCRELLTEVEP